MFIPKGTHLFRATFSTNPDLIPVYDEDTGKIGLYFSNYPILALSMSIEYNSDMTLNIYKTNCDIQIREGKYSFRNINPDRYYDYNDNLIYNVVPLEEEMINHFDSGAYPITKYEFIHYDNFGEIFLNKESLKYLEFVKTYNVDKKKLEEQVEEIGIKPYIDYGFSV